MIFFLAVFRPKVTSYIETIYKMLEELKGVSPDYISVTYGAGGPATSNRTLDIASLIKNKYNMEPVAHLTCIDAKEDELLRSKRRGLLLYVDQMYLRNILFPRKSVTAIIGVGKELVREIE